MKSVLIDSSVWIAHFRQQNPTLFNLLIGDQALTHPMILGELACGTPPQRQQILADLSVLQQAQQASIQEVIEFVEREKLYGLGCGLIDLSLLASALMTPGVELWTLDKRLLALAERFGVAYSPVQ